MNKLDQLAENLYKGPGVAPMRNAADIAFVIKYFFEEATKLVRNIKETSLNEGDRKVRMEAFEKEYGIPAKYFE